MYGRQDREFLKTSIKENNVKLLKTFSKPGIDYYIMPHSCYGNTGSKVYIKSLAEHFCYDFETDELYRTHLPNATHYLHEGHLYSTRHIWNVNHPISIFFIDGEECASLPGIPAHDRTLRRRNDEWEVCIRGFPHSKNYIAIQESADFVNWNNPRVQKINGLYESEQMYSFGIFEIDGEEYGIGNIFTKGDPFHSPNYHEHEYRVYARMFKKRDQQWFLNGITFADLQEGREQLALNICVKEGLVYLTTHDCNRKHATYCNMHEMKEKPVSSRILELSLDELMGLK